MIAYRATLDIPRELVQYVAKLLWEERRHMCRAKKRLKHGHGLVFTRRLLCLVIPATPRPGGPPRRRGGRLRSKETARARRAGPRHGRAGAGIASAGREAAGHLVSAGAESARCLTAQAC